MELFCYNLFSNTSFNACNNNILKFNLFSYKHISSHRSKCM